MSELTPGDPEPGQTSSASATERVVDRASAEKVDSMADVVITDWRAELELKREYAKWALIGLSAQVVIADLVFVGYAFAVGWKIPDPVMIAWLSATVVQVAAITVAVARGLFPGKTR